MAISNYYEYGPGSGEADSLVVMLHGVGSNGRDLISLSPMLASGLPNTKFISPDAPFPCDMVPPGYPASYQWFSLQSYVPGNPQNLLEGIQKAFPMVEDFLETLMKQYNFALRKSGFTGFFTGHDDEPVRCSRD